MKTYLKYDVAIQWFVLLKNKQNLFVKRLRTKQVPGMGVLSKYVLAFQSPHLHSSHKSILIPNFDSYYK